jgi:glycosyltransferase involved in cell wall biosynthesis
MKIDPVAPIPSHDASAVVASPMTSRVSILIPCHNAEDWIAEAVDSALAQTWAECEVIVVDDGSSDRSVEILRGFGGKIRLVARENRGGNPTRNELLSAATGEWVQYLDADDALLPDKIAEQLRVVAGDPAAEVVYGPLVIEDHTLGGCSRREWRPHRADGAHDPWAYFLHWDLTQTGGALFRRSRLLAVGGWSEEQRCCQDNELFLRLLQAGARFVHCDHAGAVYRRFAGTSVSTRDGQTVRREILRLLDEAETWLRRRGEWTPTRARAANDYRFGLARQVWPLDAALARTLMAAVSRSDPGFRPAPGPHAPSLYRFCYQWFGFGGAERISALRRRLKGGKA